MGKELIALLVILLMTVIYSLNNSASLFSAASSSSFNNLASKNISHLEIVRGGVGRIYPPKEASQNHIIVNGEPLESGDQIEYINLVEYINSENSESVGLNAGLNAELLRRGRMKGQTLLLFGMPVNLNEATIDDLTALPGIGVKTAQAIVEFREENGLFKTTEELMNVRGIGSKKFEKIKDKLTI